ncbi:YggT family protein [Fusibacter bizertensis]|uniref:YggT family protein n=1 Tax=Fusibacter bizertensis TaxID=1488331 RepID=A0ABT6NCJ2_9FIRM|nr:YggT family protein [Fusibacter bizertensis]MDH8678134.1 YggT family protein [Fusibacter bizertensis]
MKDNRAYMEKRSKVKKTIWYICGFLEVLFAFRLIFKVLGANPSSGFVSIIYSVTGVFLAPFNGIFRSAVTEGIETTSVLEPMTIIAMIVYALIVYGIVRLIEIYDPNRKA